MIGGSTYIITQIPSSLIPSSSNVHPPPYSRGPSSRHMATSQVYTAVTRPICVSSLHTAHFFGRICSYFLRSCYYFRGVYPYFRYVYPYFQSVSSYLWSVSWGIACDDLWTLSWDEVWTGFFTLWVRISTTCLLSKLWLYSSE